MGKVRGGGDRHRRQADDEDRQRHRTATMNDRSVARPLRNGAARVFDQSELVEHSPSTQRRGVGTGCPPGLGHRPAHTPVEDRPGTARLVHPRGSDRPPMLPSPFRDRSTPARSCWRVGTRSHGEAVGEQVRQAQDQDDVAPQLGSGDAADNGEGRDDAVESRRPCHPGRRWRRRRALPAPPGRFGQGMGLSCQVGSSPLAYAWRAWSTRRICSW